MRIALVAGETSGDMLGAGLIKHLKQRYPDATFEGIGGPLMIAEGMDSFHPMERLSVMGLVEVLGRLWELLGIRRSLVQRWRANPPDVFIGIDAPDFNLTLAQRLREQGIKTVHYVSPSVWAWRKKRVIKIAKAVDLMLTLFPFEAQFYQQQQVPVRFVGHHLADKIPLQTDSIAARRVLAVDESAPLVCLMPGSRRGEVAKLGDVFLQTAQNLMTHQPDIQFLIPAANEERREQILEQIHALSVALPIHVFLGQSHTCMAASNVVLLASGTATLEALLLKKPMVVSYVMAPLTFWLLKRMVTQPYISLPNLLAGRELVPEILQDDATPERLAQTVFELLQDNANTQQLQADFLQIHHTLRCHADEQAAQAVAELLS
ncbi:MAG: lipid-A-disaccharide synthase [Bacterioplanes sp.]|nr:lipid-A-disaccharide synthase [Bacterioplanes sp.]